LIFRKNERAWLCRNLRHLLGQRIGPPPRDQRLTAAGGPYSRTLWRAQLYCRKQVGVRRQLDAVPDLLDLRGQPADVGVVDVRHLFEDQLLDSLFGIRSYT